MGVASRNVTPCLERGEEANSCSQAIRCFIYIASRCLAQLPPNKPNLRKSTNTLLAPPYPPFPLTKKNPKNQTESTKNPPLPRFSTMACTCTVPSTPTSFTTRTSQWKSLPFILFSSCRKSASTTTSATSAPVAMAWTRKVRRARVRGGSWWGLDIFEGLG
ncbi:hypothetical protein EJ05DRAFT_350570 [Pseudovirgaria hyperparasitica]|uniref:Uncharacterized protein n=1 Tax=Pseudovirgaria hyperparasitica TaxID=470096 RepID=A0A6A6W6Z4_9PEZI|nr:uncharacterized protein EJ05DRAFT_350570 [Pseudovirgaria hyperparasitica]KAF2758403.1 hypothetical protein EJ05DRAFT_350570 [Pseudovirgaria hyperparasitica]